MCQVELFYRITGEPKNQNIYFGFKIESIYIIFWYSKIQWIILSLYVVAFQLTFQRTSM